MYVLKDVIREWAPLATFAIALAALVSGIVAICQFVRTLASGERIELAAFVDPESDGFVPHNSGPIRCIGYIIYKHAAGRQRETGFARRYDTVGKRWIREEGSQHDYAY